ncbi:hypothetical protein BDW67DRAFT_99327 [Aspergillus spinulosporus]
MCLRGMIIGWLAQEPTSQASPTATFSLSSSINRTSTALECQWKDSLPSSRLLIWGQEMHELQLVQNSILLTNQSSVFTRVDGAGVLRLQTPRSLHHLESRYRPLTFLQFGGRREAGGGQHHRSFCTSRALSLSRCCIFSHSMDRSAKPHTSYKSWRCLQ